jgi:hypothetical protein
MFAQTVAVDSANTLSDREPERKPGVSLEHQPASSKRLHTKYSGEEITQFAGATKSIRAEDR